MLEGDEITKKTIEDEQKEIMDCNKDARYMLEKQYMDSQYQVNTRGSIYKKYRKNEDCVFNSENDVRLNKKLGEGMTMEEAQKNIEDNDDSESSFSDKMDDMDDDELLKEEREGGKKYNNIGKKSALDRAGDVDTDNLNTR